MIETTETTTHDERRALLSVSCPWCGAAAGTPCGVSTGSRVGQVRRRRPGQAPVRSLAGGAHDARWRAALDRPAPVLGEVVRGRHVRRVVVERPW